jgi:hypothetical protein
MERAIKQVNDSINIAKEAEGIRKETAQVAEKIKGDPDKKAEKVTDEL